MEATAPSNHVIVAVEVVTEISLMSRAKRAEAVVDLLSKNGTFAGIVVVRGKFPTTSLQPIRSLRSKNFRSKKDRRPVRYGPA
ncbi:hypothetical protein MnTg02_01580 [bacterium MnTg02]|nr:hypothetical protein MnTg02_01580 [bacterium MnTg02]